jgi:hypothetical protein
MAFLEYVKHELSMVPEPRETTPEAVQRHKRKRQLVYNFFHVPLALETFMWVGVAICMDCLLSLFFDLPLRLLLALRSAVRDGPAAIQPARLVDVIRVVIGGTVVSLLMCIDLVWVYHTIRLQSILKLYVICNVLEILEKLCGTHPPNPCHRVAGIPCHAARAELAREWVCVRANLLLRPQPPGVHAS